MAKKKRFYKVTGVFIGIYLALLFALVVCAIGAGLELPQFQWYSEIVQAINLKLGGSATVDMRVGIILPLITLFPALFVLAIITLIDESRKSKWYLSNERDGITEIKVKRPRYGKKDSFTFTIKWNDHYEITQTLSSNDADWDWVVNHPRLHDRENVLGLRNRDVSNNWEDKVKADKFEKSSGESREKSVPRSGNNKKEEDSGNVFWILFVIIIFVLIAVFGVPILRLEIWVKPLTP